MQHHKKVFSLFKNPVPDFNAFFMSRLSGRIILLCSLPKSWNISQPIIKELILLSRIRSLAACYANFRQQRFCSGPKHFGGNRNFWNWITFGPKSTFEPLRQRRRRRWHRRWIMGAVASQSCGLGLVSGLGCYLDSYLDTAVCKVN